MSGGVDSSVAAALLMEQGCDVTGVFFRFGSAPAGGDPTLCRAERHAADARRVAETLGIELVEIDVSVELRRIMDYFAGEYARGRTPNPCVRCNAIIKFARLIELANCRGIRHVATGHHARMGEFAGQPTILRAAARDKDQSYALFEVPREHLPRASLPIGELDGKSRIRAIARRLGLQVHDKPDSQDICFVPDSDYVALLRRLAPESLRAGSIVNSAGEVLGAHDGYARFTIGQRRGLGVAAGAPMYVTKIDPATAVVTIGPREQVLSDALRACGARWHADMPDEFDATVQIRYNHPGALGRVRITGESAFEVRFAEPAAAITPGQAAAVYADERLLGGGWIE